jgi:arsenite methyltransferase
VPLTVGQHAPAWLGPLLGVTMAEEGGTFEVRGQRFVVRNGVPRLQEDLHGDQGRTRDVFGFKWNFRESFDSAQSLQRMRAWLIERYGDVAHAPWLVDGCVVLDAGCGAGMSAGELFGDALRRVRYLGVDLSDAVDVARARFSERGLSGAFMQADIERLPLPDASVDVLFSEGVLHHTQSTAQSFRALTRLLKPGGRFLLYVYRRKGPVREFTDDYVRERLGQMTPEEAWRAMEPLTRLGIALGELNAEVDIPDPIDVLGIPAGRVSVQRLFYWHVAKMFYRPGLTFEETCHINFDWYAPAYAHRHTPEEVRAWCGDAGLAVERMSVEEAGITVIARRH